MILFAKMFYLSPSHREDSKAPAARRWLLALALAAAAAPVAAGTGSWAPAGPEGGTVLGIVTSPVSRIVYAATANGGVFKRVRARDASWEPARAGLPLSFYRSIHTLVVAPGKTDTLYALTQYAFYRSADSGISWSPATLQGQFFTAAVAPSDPTTVYVLGLDSGVFVSTDAGITWERENQGLPFSNVFEVMVVDPTDPRTVYVAGFDSVFKTTDGGRHWSSTGPVPPGLNATAGAIDPVHPATVYIAGQRALLESEDGGTTWRDLSHGQFYCARLALAPSAPSRLYCGDGAAVLRSRDGGASWQRSSLPEQVDAVAVDPFDPDRVTAGLERLGAWQSSDGGETWQPLNHGLEATTVTLVAADPHASGTVYAAAEAGIELAHTSLGLLKSTDGGASWGAPGSGPTTSGQLDPVRQIVFDPEVAGTFYAVGSALYKTSDGGATWQTRMRGLAGKLDFARELALDPRDPTALYLLGSTRYCPPDANNCDTASISIYGLARSLDGGAHWTVLDSGPVRETIPPVSLDSVPVWGTIVAAPDGTIYVGGSQLVASGDGGASWRILTSPPGVSRDWPITRLFLVPGHRGRAADATQILYAVAPVSVPHYGFRDRLFASFDGGLSWIPADADLLTPWGTLGIGDLLAAVRRVRQLFAATDHGVFVSFGRGLHWAALDAGLEDLDVHSLTEDSTTGALFAGTEGAGGLFVFTAESP
jgi:photosystem II stability/assembly factor-like uncharacterized protein